MNLSNLDIIFLNGDSHSIPITLDSYNLIPLFLIVY